MLDPVFRKEFNVKGLIPGILALAASLTFAPTLAQAQARTITMSGQGTEQAAPDTATLSAGVSSEAPTAAAALAANTARMQGVFSALKKLGIADKDMQTANFLVSPQSVNDNNQPPHITGYRVSNQVRVRLEDVSGLGAALDALVSAGANQVNSVQFSIRDSAALMAAARADAVANAKAKAEIYAKAAGVSLGPILSITENGSEGPRPLYQMVTVSASRIAGAPPPVAAGEQNVSAQVFIVWEIH
jgi:uncharacterized protein YggE